jgi:uncharacterized protein (UPF0276 family)
MKTINIPDRGVGITYFLSLEPFIKSNLDLIDVIEVEPQNFWFHTLSNNYRADNSIFKRIRELPCKKIVHSIGIPIGGSIAPDPRQIELLNNIINELDAAWASEHLSFNKIMIDSDIVDVGFLLPPAQTKKGIEYAVTNINMFKERLSVPFAIEIGVNYLRPNKYELLDSEFITDIVTKVDCGILLDLHNIWTNEINGREHVLDFIDRIPLERVWEVHLAGGIEDDGYWLDAHAGSIPQDLLKIAEKIIPRLRNLHAIIFELYPSYYLSEVSPELVREQLKTLHYLWDINKERHNNIISNRPIINISDKSNYYTPEEWERTLGKLVNGYKVDTNLKFLSVDPAIDIYKKLIISFRNSMLIRALPLTSRLLMLTAYSKFKKILSAFHKNNMPKAFTTDEALSFLRYLESQELDIPYLKDILELESAILYCKIEESRKELLFRYDPTILLNALIQRMLPSSINNERMFKIEITPNGISSINPL